MTQHPPPSRLSQKGSHHLLEELPMDRAYAEPNPRLWLLDFVNSARAKILLYSPHYSDCGHQDGKLRNIFAYKRLPSQSIYLCASVQSGNLWNKAPITPAPSSVYGRAVLQSKQYCSDEATPEDVLQTHTSKLQLLVGVLLLTQTRSDSKTALHPSLAPPDGEIRRTTQPHSALAKSLRDRDGADREWMVLAEPEGCSLPACSPVYYKHWLPWKSKPEGSRMRQPTATRYLETHQQRWTLKWSQQAEQENHTGKLCGQRCHPRPPFTFECLQPLVNTTR